MAPRVTCNNAARASQPHVSVREETLASHRLLDGKPLPFVPSSPQPFLFLPRKFILRSFPLPLPFLCRLTLSPFLLAFSSLFVTSLFTPALPLCFPSFLCSLSRLMFSPYFSSLTCSPSFPPFSFTPHPSLLLLSLVPPYSHAHLSFPRSFDTPHRSLAHLHSRPLPLLSALSLLLFSLFLPYSPIHLLFPRSPHTLHPCIRPSPFLLPPLLYLRPFLCAGASPSLTPAFVLNPSSFLFPQAFLFCMQIRMISAEFPGCFMSSWVLILGIFESAFRIYTLNCLCVCHRSAGNDRQVSIKHCHDY